MLNPLVHRSTSDTLQDVISVLDFLEVLPYGPQQKMELSDQAAMGYFCIVQCMKSALLFEAQRHQAVTLDTECDRGKWKAFKRHFSVLKAKEQEQFLQASKQALGLFGAADSLATQR